VVAGLAAFLTLGAFASLGLALAAWSVGRRHRLGTTTEGF
jgi:hypothetical protein